MKILVRMYFLLISASMMTALSAADVSPTASLPELNLQLGAARVTTMADILTVQTGAVERQWQWTGSGLVTISVRDQKTGRQWAEKEPEFDCDWDLEGLIAGRSEARLADLSARPVTNDPYTSDHVEVVAEIAYPASLLTVKYVIWAYPDAPGIRTQLQVKGMEGFINEVKRTFPAGGMLSFSACIHPRGRDHLKLAVKSPHNNSKGSANWLNAGIILKESVPPNPTDPKPAVDVYLADLKPTTALVDGKRTLFRGQAVKIAPVEYGGKSYEKSLKVPLNSEIVFDIKPEYDRFVAGLGLDGAAGRSGDVVFEIYSNTRLLASSANLYSPGRVDYIPVSFEKASRRAIGFVKENSARNKDAHDMLQEVVLTKPFSGDERNDWASAFSVEKGKEGVILVKESHKVINMSGQPDYKTGGFRCEEAGLAATGLGLGAGDIRTDRFRPGWASWCIVYHGGDDGRELALKRFDRYRYPVDPERDLFICANTWGSTLNPKYGKRAAREENVLMEIISCKDIGIEVLQIDDGWQDKNWYVRQDWYPDGWKSVRDAARRHGITMALWSSHVISEAALKKAYDEGGFKYFKIDFFNFNSYEAMEEVTGKIGSLIEYSGHKVRVNWDNTGWVPRTGVYFGREYGNIWLENRKPFEPAHAVYVPCRVLRDAWQMAKYVNLNKLQLPIQNIEMVSRTLSNAWEYSHAYCTAIALMAAPMFFQETHYLDEAAREQIRPLLALYKDHRPEIFEGYVFPIGQRPDDAQWTGFQTYSPEKQNGYLLIFREKDAPESEKALRLKFVAGKQLALTNLIDSEKTNMNADPGGRVTFKIGQPKSFVFYRYEIL